MLIGNLVTRSPEIIRRNGIRISTNMLNRISRLKERDIARVERIRVGFEASAKPTGPVTLEAEAVTRVVDSQEAGSIISQPESSKGMSTRKSISLGPLVRVGALPPIRELSEHEETQTSSVLIMSFGSVRSMSEAAMLMTRS